MYRQPCSVHCQGVRWGGVVTESSGHASETRHTPHLPPVRHGSQASGVPGDGLHHRAGPPAVPGEVASRLEAGYDLGRGLGGWRGRSTLGERLNSCSTSMGLSWWCSLGLVTASPRSRDLSRCSREVRDTAVVIFVPSQAPGCKGVIPFRRGWHHLSPALRPPPRW